MRHHNPEIVAREVIHIAAELAANGNATMRRARDMASVLRSSPDGPSSKGTVSDPTGNLATSKPDRSLAAIVEYQAAIDSLLNAALDVERIGRWINAGETAAYVDGMKQQQAERERERVCEACESPTTDSLRSGWCDACRKANKRWLESDPRMADRTAFHARIVDSIAAGTISRPASPHTPSGRQIVHETPQVAAYGDAGDGVVG